MLFDDFRLLHWGMSANALRLEVTAQNVANVNTPGYKRQVVDFTRVLDEQLGTDELGIGEPPQATYPPPGPDADLGVQFARTNWDFERAFHLDAPPAKLWKGADGKQVPFATSVSTDPGAMRVDGNGVVIEQEMADMARTSSRYNLLATRMAGGLKVLSTIIQAR